MQQIDEAQTIGISANDLQRCHDIVGARGWQELANSRLLLTGGTGFIGKWLIASLLDAKRCYGMNCSISVLSRRPEAFLKEWPELRDQMQFMSGDVRSLQLTGAGFDVVIHAATDVVATNGPDEIFSTCIEGTSRIIELVRSCKARRLLLLSSGAVYGPLPPGMTHVPETYLGGPDPLLASSAYAEGKRVSEWLACRAADRGVHVGIARIFACVGPHLPLDKHFAIGNFIGDALAGRDIAIAGDGTAHRSYLYAADLAGWLWAILLRGRSAVAYNVGGEESLSMTELAEHVRDIVNTGVGIDVNKKEHRRPSPNHYAPDTARARKELQLGEPLDTREAIARTADWYRRRNQ